MLKKSGVKSPRVELDEIGPSFNFVLRRHHTAPAHLYKTACKVPKVAKVRETSFHYDHLSDALVLSCKGRYTLGKCLNVKLIVFGQRTVHQISSFSLF